MHPIAIHFKKSLMLPGSNAHSKQSIQLKEYKHMEIVAGPNAVLVIDNTKKITALVSYNSIESIVYEGIPNGSPEAAS